VFVAMSRPPTPPWHLTAPNPRTHRGNRNWSKDQARRQALDQRWAIRNAADAVGGDTPATPVTGDADVVGDTGVVGAVVTPATDNTSVVAAASDVVTEATPPDAMDVSTEVKTEATASVEVSSAVENALDAVLLADRQRLIASVFWICDLDHDGFLNESEMYAFARHIGFEDGEDEWPSEFIELCTEFKVTPSIGINRVTFDKMLNDDSHRGCFCSDKELRKFLEFLGKLSTAASSSSSQMDSSGAVRCGMTRSGEHVAKEVESSVSVAGATRGSAAGAATPGPSSVAVATGGASVAMATGTSPLETALANEVANAIDEDMPEASSRDRTPRRSRSTSSSSTTESAPSAPPGPLANADPTMVARVWDTIAEHLDAN
jgi:hypothetical protein